MKAGAIDDVLARIEPRFAASAVGSLLSIALLALALYGVRPLWLARARLADQARLAELEAPAGTRAERRAQIAQLEQEIAALKDRLYGGAAAVPRREIESFVIDALDQLSTHHGVKLLGITPDEPSEVIAFEEIPFRIDVEGSYFALHAWLLELEERLRPMVVKKFSLSHASGGEGVALDLRVVAYRNVPREGA